MNVLLILDGQPYATERTYNGLRLAVTLLSKVQDQSVTVFLTGDAVAAAKTGQQTPIGCYNPERMVKGVVKRKGRALLCGTCMDARGLKAEGSVAGPPGAPWTS